jgi:hypothetical protein
MTGSEKNMSLPPDIKTPEEYYLWQSQANTFHPRFEELSEETRKRWVEEFERARSNTSAAPKA